MLRNKHISIVGAFVLAALGFLFGFWPLSIAGVLLAAFAGRFVVAILLGLLLDVAYGTPLGRLHFLLFPFTSLALLGIIARHIKLRYFRKPPVDHL